MITGIVILVCMYRYVFSDFSITEQQTGMLILAVIMEGFYEAGIYYIYSTLRERR